MRKKKRRRPTGYSKTRKPPSGRPYASAVKVYNVDGESIRTEPAKPPAIGPYGKPASGGKIVKGPRKIRRGKSLKGKSS